MIIGKNKALTAIRTGLETRKNKGGREGIESESHRRKVAWKLEMVVVGV
jgi:hypothetical protein